MGKAQRRHEQRLQDSVNQTNLQIHQMDNQFNERMAEKANLWNIEQYEREVAQQDKNWQRDAEYNSASAQVQRYRDAGLNPTIMMQGQGAGSAISQNVPHVTSSQASAGSPIPMQAPHQTPTDWTGLLGNLNDSISNFADATLKVEQVQGMKLDNRRKEQQMIYDLQRAKSDSDSASYIADINKMQRDLIKDTRDFDFNTKKYEAAFKQELYNEKKQAAEYQRLVTEGAPERLAAELAKIKFDSSIDWDKKLQFAIKSVKEFLPNLEDGFKLISLAFGIPVWKAMKEANNQFQGFQPVE